MRRCEIIALKLFPKLPDDVKGQDFHYASSPANHDEQRRASYQHDLYQREPILYKHISHI